MSYNNDSKLMQLASNKRKGGSDMKRRHKVVAAAVLILLVISIGLNIALAGNQQADPGSDQDPIVSKSYVDAVFSQLSTKVQLLLDQYDAMKNLLSQMSAKLAEQEKTIKALHDELNAIKSGIPAGAPSQPEQTSKAVVNVAVLNVRSGTINGSKKTKCLTLWPSASRHPAR
jgi:uncharacterized protein HemX